MDGTLLKDAFGHHVWATLRVLDVCDGLNPDQLEATAEGTYGSILDTMRHLIAADCSYLNVLTGGEVAPVREETLSPADLRTLMVRNGGAWTALLEGELDPDAVLIRRRDDGSESHAPTTIRLAQALHHGTDHRSQVCTVLSTLGIDPPAIDVWDFAAHDQRLVEVPPAR